LLHYAEFRTMPN